MTFENNNFLEALEQIREREQETYRLIELINDERNPHFESLQSILDGRSEMLAVIESIVEKSRGGGDDSFVQTENSEEEYR